MDLRELSGDQEVLQKLEEGLKQAYSLHIQWLEYFGDGITLGHKGFKEELEKLYKGLTKLADGRGTEAAAIKSINDAIRMIPPIDLEYFDSFLDGFTPSELPGRFVKTAESLNKPETDKKCAADQLIKAVYQIMENMNHLGRGRGNKKASQYAEGINILRGYFADAMPGYLTNGGRGSKFHRYVEIWFIEYLKKDTIQNFDRIIDRAK